MLLAPRCGQILGLGPVDRCARIRAGWQREHTHECGAKGRGDLSAALKRGAEARIAYRTCRIMEGPYLLSAHDLYRETDVVEPTRRF